MTTKDECKECGQPWNSQRQPAVQNGRLADICEECARAFSRFYQETESDGTYDD